MLEQALPRGQARDRQARAHREVDVARQRGEIACLDRRVFRQGAVTGPVREAEHPLAHRQPRRAVAERADHSGQLVAGDRRCPVPAEAVGPRRGPGQLTWREARRVHLHQHVVDRRLGLGPLGQCHPGRSRGLVRHHDRLHPAPPRIRSSPPCRRREHLDYFVHHAIRPRAWGRVMSARVDWPVRTVAVIERGSLGV